MSTAEQKRKTASQRERKQHVKGAKRGKGVVHKDHEIIPPKTEILAHKEIHKPNPGQTPADELDARVAFTVSLLQKGLRKNKIKLQLKKLFGVSARTCESYLSRARKELLEETGKPRPEHVADLYAVMSGIIGDKKSSASDKIRAAREIRHLLLLSGERMARGPVLNQQINIGGAPVAELANEEGLGDVPLRDMELESRRARISALAERVRIRAIPDRTGESGAG